MLPNTYTLFHVARFTPGGLMDRIFTSFSMATCNWASGFQAGSAYEAYHNAFMTSNGFSTNQWLLSSDQWPLYRGQGIDRTTAAPGAWCAPQLSINHEAASDFQVAAILVYNYAMSAPEMEAIERWLVTRYALGALRSHVTAFFANAQYVLLCCVPVPFVALRFICRLLLHGV
jgi:hypothetical protein